MKVFCWKQLRRVSSLAASSGLLVVAAAYALLVFEPDPPCSVVWFKGSPNEDLPAIRQRGVLRVAIPADGVALGEHRGVSEGLAFDLALRTARHLGLELEVIKTGHASQGLRQVLAGEADLLALADPGPDPVASSVAWTPPIETAFPVVIGRRAAEIQKIRDLSGRAVAVTRFSRLESLALAWAKGPARGLEVVRLAPDSPVSELATRAATGRLPLVLLDEGRARLEAAVYPNLQVSAPLGEALPIRWATRPVAPLLLAAVSRELESSRAIGLVAELERRYMENPGRQRTLRFLTPAPAAQGAGRWQDLFQQTGRQHGLDWRLLAALAFIESRHDHRAIGPGGAKGLFQLIPRTAAALGLEDPFDPVMNADAGARHLRLLMDVYQGLPENDRLAFSLAAYNIGRGHLEDIRALAASRGLNPSRWDGHVAAVMPMKEDPEVASGTRHGAARGSRTVNYVRRVLDLYRKLSGQPEQPVQTAARSVPENS